MNKDKLINEINAIIREEKSEEKPKPKKKKKSKRKIKPGEIGLSVGRGGFTMTVADAGALATQNPKKLMGNLKIKSGGKGLTGAVQVLKQALVGTDAMKQAFGGLSKVSKGGKTGYSVGMGVLNARNGAKFIHHTLMGAKNAGLFNNNEEPLQVQVIGNEVIVYSSDMKGSWSGE